MPDRDFNPKDGGFIRIMNEFVDKLISYRLDSNEWSIVMLIIRWSWGVNGRPWVELKWHEIMDKTQLSDSSLAKSMRKLRRRNLIHTLENKKQITRYKINSKVSTWKDPAEFTATEGSKNLLPPKAVNTAFQGSNLTNLLPSKAVIPIKDNIIKNNNKDTPYSPPLEIPTEKLSIPDQAKFVIDRMNELSGKQFSYSKALLSPIIARLSEGFSLQQCLQVCHTKWRDPDHDAKWYRPATLFSPDYFEGYLNEQGCKQKPSNKKSKMQNTIEIFARRKHERETPTGGS